ncbi:LPS assembly lipoprotein LptE [Mesorhizobium sp. 1B3]|uniref:LPS assembly lipoprotein LptE n=1 Tax=Mesorhizobium sp. 1B3 TaxID=3243599 RepID=UPI003D9996C2
MSSPERKSNPVKKGGLLGLAVVVSAMALQACTVRPLYYNPPEGTGAVSMASRLSSVSIKPVSTRQAQEVRNHLIFLMYGGAAAPSSPEYSLDLTVASIVEWAATVQVTTLDDEPTASTVTMTGSYAIKRAKTGEVVATGRREVTSSFDVPRQEFAALRAQRDAENRAARELAEMLHLAIAQDITRK